MDPITITFAFERETKRTKRFQEVVEDGQQPVVGTLYVQKDALERLSDANNGIATDKLSVSIDIA